VDRANCFQAYLHVNLSLTREDGAVLYPVDGRSDLTITDVVLA